VYWISSLMGQIRWGVRGGFLALIGGLIVYCYLALDGPGSAVLVTRTGTWGVVAAILVGTVLGLSTTIGWRTLQRKRL